MYVPFVLFDSEKKMKRELFCCVQDMLYWQQES